jgi:predicted nucleotide-binding protein
MIEKNKINQLLTNIARSEIPSFKGSVSHLLNYLEKEESQNSTYLTFKTKSQSFNEWPALEGPSGWWEMPSNEDDALSLTFALYKLIEECNEPYQIPLQLFPPRSKNGNESIARFNETFLPLLEELINIIMTKTEIEKSTVQSDPQKVFVVHGRNSQLRTDMFSFLRSIGLKPIEWSEAISMTGKSAPYVGEILDIAFSIAQAIVILITPDDEARLLPEYLNPDDPDYERNYTPQARPNVIFEAGMAIGRNADRTVFVEFGNNLRPFSDIAGRHTVKMNNRTEDRQSLANRLKIAGCSVNLNGTDWHTIGKLSL